VNFKNETKIIENFNVHIFFLSVLKNLSSYRNSTSNIHFNTNVLESPYNASLSKNYHHTFPNFKYIYILRRYHCICL
jgi:hypothetical protein